MISNIEVIHVVGSLGFGGLETRLLQLLESNLAQSNVRYQFVVHSSEVTPYFGLLKKNNIEIRFIRRFNGINLVRYAIDWYKLLNNNKIDIIHGHLTSTAIIYLSIARLLGVKVRIAHARNSNADNIFKSLMTKLAFVQATHLIAVSREAADFEFSLSNRVVTILNNAYDIEKYRFHQKTRNEIRLQLGLEEKLVFGHIGRFHKQKNHKFLIDLFKVITEEHKDVTLLLVGDGEQKTTMISYVKSLDLENEVTFIESSETAHHYYNAMDMFLFPSIFEGFPGVVMEAQINGLPVIISENVTKEVMNSNNIFILPLQIESWVNEIKKVELNTDRREACKSYLNSKFDVRIQHQKLVGLYLEAMGKVEKSWIDE